MQEFDVAIVGAGPAGATLARLLAGKMSVVIIDPKHADGDFHKPCGGLLSGDAQKSLSQFNLTLPKDVLVDPQIFSVKTIDLTNDLTRSYQRFYVNLDRHRFDLWLQSLIPDSVTRLCAKVTDFAEASGGFLLTCGDEAVKAKRIIGADGANSAVRRRFFPNVKIPYYVAVQQWFEEHNPKPFYSCIFDKATSDCCSWTISKDDFFIYGGAFSPKNCKAMFERQKARLEQYGLIFGEPQKTEACLVLRPKRHRHFCSGSGSVMLIGEAAGFISPSSFEGFSYAFDSAALLAECLLNTSQDAAKRYRLATRKIRLKILGKVVKCPFMYNSFLRKIVMKSGLQSIKIREEKPPKA